jgi:predicted porin
MLMKKSLIALAVASALSTSAFAATSNVDIYGQIDLSVDRVSGLEKGAPGQSNDAFRLSSNTSRIGLKGSEDLGGGLAGIWQFEQGVSFDSQAKGGINNGSGSGWGSLRNTFLGLKGNWGTVLGGNYDTPYKSSTYTLDPFADTMGDYNAIIGSFGGLNTSDLRMNNSLVYMSPSFSGLSFALGTSFQKESGLNNNSNNTTNGKPAFYSGMVKYENGPLFLSGAYETAKHLGACNGINCGTVGSFNENIDTKSWKVGAGYSFGDFVVNAVYDNIKVKVNTGTTDVKRSAYGLNGVYTIGNIALKAGAYKAGKISGNKDSSASLYEVGGDYMLSKRTKVYALYAKVNNDKNAAYDLGGAAASDYGPAAGVPSFVTPGANGRDPGAFSIGVRHTF